MPAPNRSAKYRGAKFQLTIRHAPGIPSNSVAHPKAGPHSPNICRTHRPHCRVTWFLCGARNPLGAPVTCDVATEAEQIFTRGLSAQIPPALAGEGNKMNFFGRGFAKILAGVRTHTRCKMFEKRRMAQHFSATGCGPTNTITETHPTQQAHLQGHRVAQHLQADGAAPFLLGPFVLVRVEFQGQHLCTHA